MPRTPYFSVVIPVHNRAGLLADALESVFRQHFRHFEVIVVDDGSTDDLGPVVDRFRAGVTFVRQENAGPGVARNRGALAARGEYLAFLDSDDLWFPWTLAIFGRVIREHHQPAVVSGRLVEFSSPAELAAVRLENLEIEAFGDFLASSRRISNAGTCTLVVRREEFLKAGGFVADRINEEDHDLVLRLGTAAGFVKLRQPATLGYRRHPQKLSAEIQKTCAGAMHLVSQEGRGAYPGGRARARERREILARHVRPVIVACLENGLRSEAWQLYRATALWQLGLGRWRFLAAVPAKAIFRRIRAAWLHVAGRLRSRQAVATNPLS
jgi:glycosyltransferase involved in cell wall biosynthesis